MFIYYWTNGVRIYLSIFFIIWTALGIYYSLTEPWALLSLIPPIVLLIASRFDETWMYTKRDYDNITIDYSWYKRQNKKKTR